MLFLYKTMGHRGQPLSPFVARKKTTSANHQSKHIQIPGAVSFNKACRSSFRLSDFRAD